MPDVQKTTDARAPETGYGKSLRAAADKIDSLIWRECVCDSECGAMHSVAHSWYRAEEEFGLEWQEPYEAISALMARVKELEAKQ